MRRHPQQNRKQQGFIVTVEMLFILTILVIGLVVGWIEIRNATLAEMSDAGEAIGAMDQGYEYQGTMDTGSTAVTEGSTFVDALDQGDGFSDTPSPMSGNASNTGMTVVLPAADTETSGNL